MTEARPRALGLRDLEQRDSTARAKNARALREQRLERDDVAECETARDRVDRAVANGESQAVAADQRSG
jgi:hypothetical protein